MKYIQFSLLLLLGLSFHSCLVEDDGLTQIDDVAAPSDLSLLFTIANDNSGLVTLIPNGTGVTAYTIDFGDGSGVTSDLRPGETDTYVYPEGTYNVVLTATGISGLTTTLTQELTVSFQAPENFDVTIVRTPGDPLSIDVSATADLETNFEAYFGEMENEEPLIFLEGQTVTYTYGDIGEYVVRVVARSGGAAFAEFTDTVNITVPILLPVDFESPVADYTFTVFNGAESSVIDNPDPSGLNPSARVARTLKTVGAATFAGSILELGEPIDFSSRKAIRVKTWSPKANISVLLKLENATDPDISTELMVTTTTTGAWEELLFDFSEANLDNEYQKVILFFDFGVEGDGTEYYFDDIELTNPPNVDILALPLDFESATLDYSFTNFNGTTTEVIDNPDPSGLNISARVGRTNKGAGAATFAGSFIDLVEPIDFSESSVLNLKTWSPVAGIEVRVKVENTENADENIEVFTTATVANQWEELSFDFSSGNLAGTYDRVVIFFDFGNDGTGADYYFDDLALAGSELLTLPLTFESANLTYLFSGFGGGSTEVIDNPDMSGINTSGRVAASAKAEGAQNFAGSFIELAEPIDFGGSSKLRLKVWSPTENTTVRLKFENLADADINTELEVTASAANTWEEVEFDFGTIEQANDYQRVVLFFNFGPTGMGLTYYFDDLRVVN